MSRPSMVIVLVEDERHQQFVFRYLRRIGLEPHAMRFVGPLSGSGEQWVREQFPIEVAAFRRRNARVETKLIAVIDADNLTVQARLAQLDQKLQEKEIGPIRTESEQVARLIPKRNIETWILYLNAVDVDEETDYKRPRNDWTELLRSAGKMLYTVSRPNAPYAVNCISSLRHGIGELRRLNFSDV
jgi:hypothetical protein